MSTGDVCAGNATSWIGQVNAEVFAGFSDWQVPTRDELGTIVDLSAGPPRIDPIFGSTQASRYWSLTECAFNCAWAWNFFDGVLGFPGKWPNVYPVRAMRLANGGLTGLG